MDEEPSFKELVRVSNEKARRCLDVVRDNPNDHTVVHRSLTEFVRCKYLLDESEMTTDDLAELSQISLNKMLNQYHKETLKDISSVCTGSSSASTKKVLLVMAIQKGLGIKFEPEVFGKMASLDLLTEAVMNEMAVDLL